METLELYDFELFVQSDRGCYNEGMFKAQHLSKDVAWIMFVDYCLARYSKEVLKKYNRATIPLESWGVMAKTFRDYYTEKARELRE